MRKNLLLAGGVFIAALFLQNCNSAKNTYVTPVTFTYSKDIVPIMQTSCTPCHFPPEGKKVALNSFETVKDNIGDIIHSVTVPKDNHKFMPFKNKKPALTESQIAVFVTWQKEGMPN
ncbi:hypothetical protein [Flavobacterium cellulosilyticum]|uniref:Cytochrome c domain-containing protein n=1 Tax=Flavobacterium cellulosilyticum TaxID=2541731 RepID=A0A4R5C9X8_9FLAO|nr:hypothetical protein [Flavobacterium cellulosilyticum]TDD95579.1 hypothetical protein E0F76_14055 [Flavobacterium cellulosilyticum]